MMPDLPRARLRASLASLCLVSLTSVQVLHGAIGASGAGVRLERAHSDTCVIVHNEALCPFGTAGLLALPPGAISPHESAAAPAAAPAAVPTSVRPAAPIGLPLERAPPPY